jgi:hypothetical protein
MDADGPEEDALANIARCIKSEISKYKTWSALPFRDKDRAFTDPLLLWKQKQFHLPILAGLA